MPLIMHKGQNFSGWGTSDIYNNYLGSFIDLNNVIQPRFNMVGNSTYTYTATEDCCVIYYVWANNPNNNDYSYIQIENEIVDMSFQTGGIQCVLNDVKYLAKGQTMTFKTGTITTGNPCYYTVYGVQKSNSDIGFFASDDVLFEGFADTNSASLNLSKSIRDYDYLLIYTSLASPNSTNHTDSDATVTTLLRVDHIKNANTTSYNYGIGWFPNSSYNYSVYVDFPTDTSFCIYSKQVVGWSTCGVTRIVGIKFKEGSGGGGGGTFDYEELENLPSINDVTLTGDKTSEDLGIVITLTQAEYDELTTEEKADPNKVYYISDGVSEYTVYPVIYSSEEREVGVWKDGLPLYQKTWELNVPSTAGSGARTFYNPVPNLKEVVYTEYSVDGIGEKDYSVYASSVNANISFEHQSATIIEFSFDGSYYSGKKIYYTSRYTKTTDQPGSGSYTPQGVPAVHYSTNEQIIGTWIDGKTLYQKTWELTIPNASGTYLFNESVPNLETVAKSDYTFRGKGPRGYTPWYSNATILFSEQTDSYIEFYFASNIYAGEKIIYTSQYTKST